ncbi:hypothetical protein QQ045_028188 [Rhodiola kirilowii]
MASNGHTQTPVGNLPVAPDGQHSGKPSFTAVARDAKPTCERRFQTIRLPARQYGTKDGKPSIAFTIAEQQAGIENLRHSQVVKFSGGRPPIEVIRTALLEAWSPSGACSIGTWDARHILAVMESEHDFRKALSHPSRKMGHSLFRVFRWSVAFDSKTEPSSVSTWVRMTNLPPQLFNPGYIELIANSFGRFLAVDNKTAVLSNPSFARALVSLLPYQTSSTSCRQHDETCQRPWSTDHALRSDVSQKQEWTLVQKRKHKQKGFKKVYIPKGHGLEGDCLSPTEVNGYMEKLKEEYTSSIPYITLSKEERLRYERKALTGQLAILTRESDKTPANKSEEAGLLIDSKVGTCSLWEIWLSRNNAMYGDPGRPLNKSIPCWADSLAPNIQAEYKPSFHRQIALDYLHISYLSNNIKGNWTAWSPAESGLTLNLAVFNFWCAGILRDSSGTLHFAFRIKLEYDDFIKGVISSIMLLNHERWPFFCVQCSHQDSRSIGSENFGGNWAHYNRWKEGRQLMDHTKVVKIDPALNDAAIALCFKGGTDGIFYKVSQLPKVVRVALTRDYLRLPTWLRKGRHQQQPCDINTTDFLEQAPGTP